MSNNTTECNSSGDANRVLPVINKQHTKYKNLKWYIPALCTEAHKGQLLQFHQYFTSIVILHHVSLSLYHSIHPNLVHNYYKTEKAVIVGQQENRKTK